MTRKEANMAILKQLKHYLTMNPDQRFGQALRNTGVIVDFMVDGEYTPRWSNHFNEESDSTLERVIKTKKENK